MINKINIKIIFIISLLFIFLQFFFSFYSEDTLLSDLGIFQIYSIAFFIFFYFLSQKATIKEIFLLIFVYQIFLVFSLFTYYITVYGNPLGFQPTDEILYNSLGNELQNRNYSESIGYVISNYGIADLGFPLIVKFVYSLGGNEIFNMKIFNILFHLLSCFFLFKTSKLLFTEKSVSKTLLILYGLNPISIYFNASGRKEPLFILIVTVCFFFVYKAIIEKNFKYYVLAFLSVLLTGLFRTIFPVFVILAFGFLILIDVKGRYRVLKRLAYIFLGLIVLGITIIFIQKDLEQAMSVDLGALAAYRIGRVPSVLDNIIMILSGLIGPFPSFSYRIGNDSALLQTVGNFVKLFLSYFFLVGVYTIIMKKIRIFYPILLFILFNIVMLVSVAASLDHRFLYPFIPAYFIIIAYGYSLIKERKSFNYFYPYLIFITSIMIAYNIR